ncbi:PAS domain-containing protein [Tardiphaga sp. P5_C7]
MKHFQNAMDLIGATPRILLDKLRVGIAVVDARNSEILFANDEFARIVGCASEDLAERRVSFLSLTHPSDRALNSELQYGVVSGRSDRYALEKRYLRGDGSVVWAKVTVDVIHRSVDTTWTVSLVEDISDRKILEQQLDAVENVAPIATWTWAIAKNVTNISSSYNALHGLPDSAPPPTYESVMQQVHPDDRQGFAAAINRGITGRVGVTHEYRGILPSGQIKWYRFTATCLYDAKGDVENFVGATVDITDAKTREFSSICSASMREVLRHMAENWNTQISVTRLAKSYGISSRSIHKYFATRGTTPNRHLKNIRLREARLLLQSSDHAATVTAVALRCGFSNMGHFAKDYRLEFGESPSDTVKAARR